MAHLAFEWDPKKEASNVSKHGVSFAEAQTAFTDEFARLIPDPDHSANEDRFILLGTSISPDNVKYFSHIFLKGVAPVC
ncbi:MAG: BrnT family toxin [Gammaproteobacteria bacterium]